MRFARSLPWSFGQFIFDPQRLLRAGGSRHQSVLLKFTLLHREHVLRDAVERPVEVRSCHTGRVGRPLILFSGRPRHRCDQLSGNESQVAKVLTRFLHANRYRLRLKTL
jgi:hypothetical protein